MITVLFVDDEPALLDGSRLYLEKTGDLKVETCFSTEQAIEILKERSFDVIVSDYEMPGIDGIAFLKTIRKLGDRTPFIIFTGRGREHVVIEALNSGADFYLQKGGDPKSQFTELVHKIRLAVQRKRGEISLRIARHSVEKASIQIFWLDVRGRFIYANEASCEALGYQREELMLLSISDVDPLFSRDEWNRFVERLRFHKSIVLQAVHARKDRQKIPVEVSFTWEDFEGRSIIFAYAWNTREIPWFEEYKKEAELRCHLVADVLPRMYYEVASNGALQFWNTAASEYTGHPFNGKTTNPRLFQDLVLQGQRGHISSLISRVGEGTLREIIQIPLICHDGTQNPVLFQARGYVGYHDRHYLQLLEIPRGTE